jgi:hypothetical protein
VITIDVSSSFDLTVSGQDPYVSNWVCGDSADLAIASDRVPLITMDVSILDVNSISVEDVTARRNSPDGAILAASDLRECLLIWKSVPLTIVGVVILVKEDLTLMGASSEHPNVTVTANGY